MTSKALASGAVVVALLVSRAASAQTVQPDSPAWLRSPKYTEGIGVRAGDFELHPGIAGEVGYDSNYMLRTDRTSCPGGLMNRCDNGPPGAPVIPSLEFRVTPSFSLSTLGPERREGDAPGTQPSITFRAGVNGTYREFIGLSSDSTGPNDISRQRNMSVGAGLALGILPGAPWGGSVFANYARDIQPNRTTADPNLSFDRDDIGGGGELIWQPGSGTLDWHLGYQYRATLFEQPISHGFNNGTHEIFTRGRWRFRPRTALFYDATLRFISYTNTTLAAQQGLVGSTPIRTRIGLNGLVTDRFALLALVGWAASLYDTSSVAQQPQYDSLMAQAELTWFLAASPGVGAPSGVGLALSSITLGYTRDFANSYLGNFYGSDRGYLRFAYFFASRALVTLEGGVGVLEYPTMYWIPPATPTVTVRHTAFNDVRADATLFAEYRVTDTFGLNATLRYTTNISNTHDMPDQPMSANAGVFDMAWNRFEAFLGARFFW